MAERIEGRWRYRALFLVLMGSVIFIQLLPFARPGYPVADRPWLDGNAP